MSQKKYVRCIGVKCCSSPLGLACLSKTQPVNPTAPIFDLIRLKFLGFTLVTTSEPGIY